MLHKSRLLRCPLPYNFFTRQGKNHPSQIRRLLHQYWGLNSKQLLSTIRDRLIKYGSFIETRIDTQDWEGAIKYAEEWNRYDGYKEDKIHFQSEINLGKVAVEKGTIEMDHTTWLTLASIAFEHPVEKESPNHFFLKELFRQYVYHFIDKKAELLEEEYITLYGDSVRLDLLARLYQEDRQGVIDSGPSATIVGEMGGVQLWKVMALVYQGYSVYVLPHWTRQKTNPFLRKRLSYDFYRFELRKELTL